MGAETRNEQFTEFGMLSFTKDLPDVTVAQCDETCNLELKEMVLVRVQVDGVHSARAVLQIVQDVITSTGDRQDHIIASYVQETVVDTRIFPVESVDILVLELSVLREQVIVANPIVVVLVEGRRQREVRVQVDDGRLVSLGADFTLTLLVGLLDFLAVVGGRQVRRLSERSIQFLDSILARGTRHQVLLAANKDIVGNASKEVVPFTGRDDSSEAVLQVVSTGSLKRHTIQVEPGTPEKTTKPVDMTVKGTTNVVARRDVDNALDCFS